ncbi:MAG: carbohydrate porin [Akkermansia sp.]
MNTKHIMTMAAAGLSLCGAAFAAEGEPRAGDIHEGINMFTPEDGDPAYKVTAHERYGTQWAVALAYAYWGIHRCEGEQELRGKNHNYALLHAQLNQRIISDSVNGGTWLRAEFSGSWGLDKRSSHSDEDLVGSFGSTTDVHGDHFGPHNGGLPELALMQYLQGKRLCIIGGVVNLTNYFDAVSIANDSFSSFVNTGFMNSTVVPLPDSNLGVVVQRELGKRDYVMLAASRTGCECCEGQDPFASKNKDGYVLVGEYGHMFGDGDATLRLTPFYQRFDSKVYGENHHNAGIGASIEWNACERATLYTRAGIAAKQQWGNTAELSVGANVKLLPSREDDFFGIAAGVFKGQAPYGAWDEETEEPLGGQNHRREYVVEVMYSLQLTDYCKVVPHYQYISRPSGAAISDESLFGAQVVFSF